MNTNSIPLEIFGDTLDEAVKKGLAQLGATRDEVTVEVVDEGNRGVFGIGARPVHIRIYRKDSAAPDELQEVETPYSSTTSTSDDDDEDEDFDLVYDEDFDGDDEGDDDYEIEDDDEEESTATRESAADEAGDDENLRISRDAVSELLGHMDINAKVNAYYGEADERSNQKPIHVEIRGRDLSILIGRKAETLNALQFITKLIVGKEFGHSVPIIVDVEGYRGRRESEIRQLARRMADQVTATGRPLPLEPMPANERRLVHLELRKNPNVFTESTGEGPKRKVVIKPEG